jgi:hypothetical protein
MAKKFVAYLKLGSKLVYSWGVNPGGCMSLFLERRRPSGDVWMPDKGSASPGLPIEPNSGQADSRARSLTRGPDYSLFSAKLSARRPKFLDTVIQATDTIRSVARSVYRSLHSLVGRNS